jgi:photosystem II stability/assembly factor-like uncharacterized protein
MNLPPLSRLLPALAVLLLAACPDPDGPGNTDPDGGTGRPDGGGRPDSGTPNLHGWHRVESPGGSGNVSDIFFLDAQRGWMTVSEGVNNGVFSTSNAGATWTHQKRDYSAFTVTALPDGNSVWVAGSDSPTLFASTNGGQDLAPVRTAVADFPRALHFWDSTTGLIASEVGDRVRRTTDSGATWSTHTFTREVMPGIHELAVLGNEVWVVGGPSFTSNGTGANIGYSADRGATWSTRLLEDKAHDYKGGSLQGVAVVNTNEVWVAGLNRQLYFTKDKMQTWTQVRNVPSDIVDFRGIAISGDHIVAGCHLHDGICIYESFDHGATWAITFTEACDDLCDVRGVVFAGPDTAYIYGYNGTLVRN